MFDHAHKSLYRRDIFHDDRARRAVLVFQHDVRTVESGKIALLLEVSQMVPDHILDQFAEEGPHAWFGEQGLNVVDHSF